MGIQHRGDLRGTPSALRVQKATLSSTAITTRLSPGGISSRYIDLLQAQSAGDSKAAEQLVQDAFRNIESLANRPLSGEGEADTAA